MKPVTRNWYGYFICTWGCGTKVEIGFITHDHDGFNAKANLTIHSTAVTRCYVWRSSILDWTAVHAHSTLSFIISKQLREIKFVPRFLWCIVSKNSTPKVITGYCVITFCSVFGYSIAVQYSLSLSLIYILWTCGTSYRYHLAITYAMQFLFFAGHQALPASAHLDTCTYYVYRYVRHQMDAFRFYSLSNFIYVYTASSQHYNLLSKSQV